MTGLSVKAVLTERGHRWGRVLDTRRGQEEEKARDWRLARGTQDTEQRSPAKILRYGSSGKGGLQPRKYSG